MRKFLILLVLIPTLSFGETPKFKTIEQTIRGCSIMRNVARQAMTFRQMGESKEITLKRKLNTEFETSLFLDFVEFAHDVQVANFDQNKKLTVDLFGDEIFRQCYELAKPDMKAG